MLAEAGYPDAPIFPVSSHTGDGIAALTRHLQDAARRAHDARAAAPPAGLFRMAIDRAFTLPGIGLVATGTVTAGAVAVGDRLTVSPRGIPVRVRGLHAHNHPIDMAGAGERCAINIAGSFPDGGEPRRGDWLVAPERHLPVRRLDLAVRASRHAEIQLRDGMPVHLHIGTEDVVGRAAVLSGRTIAPGETGFVQIDLDQPIAALHGDRVVRARPCRPRHVGRRPCGRPAGATARPPPAGAARRARGDGPGRCRERVASRCWRKPGSSTSRNSRLSAI